MVALRKIILLIVALLAAAAFMYLVLRGLATRPEVFSAPDREKLVRYYACMLAICTKGCGHEWLDENKTPGEIAICVERDPITKKCNKWCQDICNENGWPNGKYCDQNHNVTVDLEGEVPLKGLYDTRDVSRIWEMIYRKYYRTEILDILKKLKETENFPWLDLLEYGASFSHGADCPLVGPCRCDPEYYVDKNYYNLENKYEARGLGLILDTIYKFCEGEVSGYNKPDIGVGSIILLPTEAREKFGCIDKTFWDVIHLTFDAPGYYSCLFKGSVKMWAIPCSRYKGCQDADIVLVSNTYHPDHFNLIVEPTEIIKPIENWATYNATIQNYMYSSEESTFTLVIYSPENVTCKWKDTASDIISITIKNNSAESLLFECKATYPGDYEIKIRATNIFVEWAFVKLTSTDYKLECAYLDCKKKLYANREETFNAIKIKNELFTDATFSIQLDQQGNEGNLSCKFENGDTSINVTIANMSTYTLKLTCKPTSEAAGKSYDIVFITSVEGFDDLVKEIIFTLNVSSCKGPLQIKFLDANGQEINSIEAGNEVKIELYAEGCDGASVMLAVGDPGYKIAKGSLDSNGNYVYYKGKTSTPGTYTFYAWADLTYDNDFDDPEESATKSFNVTSPPSQSSRNCLNCSNKQCTYSFGTCGCGFPCTACGDICDQWNDGVCCFGAGYGNCKDALDPQECVQDDNLGCASYSNICCLYDFDFYSNGPESQPVDINCDSFDKPFHKEDCEETQVCSWCGCWVWITKIPPVGYCTDFYDYVICKFPPPGFVPNIEWRGCEGGTVRAVTPSPAPCLSPDINTHPDVQTKYFQWDNVDNARNVLVGEPTGKERAATIKTNGWLKIVISSESSGRPVYGIYIKARSNNNTLIVDFLDSSNSVLRSISRGLSGGYTDIIRAFYEPIPNVYAIKLYPGRSDQNARDILIDYIGLLTRNGITPFCTEGSGDYRRIVDNGKTCYWGLDCNATGKGGWTYKAKSTSTGFLGECDCSSGTCGLGYCERCLDSSGNEVSCSGSFEAKYCFSDVRCMNGGWRWGKFKKCDSGKECTIEGCK